MQLFAPACTMKFYDDYLDEALSASMVRHLSGPAVGIFSTFLPLL